MIIKTWSDFIKAREERTLQKRVQSSSGEPTWHDIWAEGINTMRLHTVDEWIGKGLLRSTPKPSILYEYRNEDGVAHYDSQKRSGGLFIDGTDYQLTGVTIKVLPE